MYVLEFSLALSSLFLIVWWLKGWLFCLWNKSNALSFCLDSVSPHSFLLCLSSLSPVSLTSFYFLLLSCLPRLQKVSLLTLLCLPYLCPKSILSVFSLSCLLYSVSLLSLSLLSLINLSPLIHCLVRNSSMQACYIGSVSCLSMALLWLMVSEREVLVLLQKQSFVTRFSQGNMKRRSNKERNN